MDIVNKSKIYESDSNLLFSCQYHVIFCPKYRRKVLVGQVESRLKEIILEKTEEYGGKIIELEIMPDHVHLLVSVNPKFGIYRLVSKLKGVTSQTLRKEFPKLKSRLPCMWSGSRFISTVGSVSLDVVKSYIENQKKQNVKKDRK